MSLRFFRFSATLSLLLIITVTIFIIIIIITILSSMLVARLWLFPCFSFYYLLLFSKFCSICICKLRSHNEYKVLLLVLCYPRRFHFLNLYSCCYSYSYHCKVILVFLFNDLLYLTVKSLFSPYIFFFA